MFRAGSAEVHLERVIGLVSLKVTNKHEPKLAGDRLTTKDGVELS